MAAMMGAMILCRLTAISSGLRVSFMPVPPVLFFLEFAGMNISQFYAGIYAERVCGHKWAFAAARTISLGAHMQNSTPYFSRNDAITLSKYRMHAAHQALIRHIALPSQLTLSSSPAIIFSIVSAQYLLYGISISGNS